MGGRRRYIAEEPAIGRHWPARSDLARAATYDTDPTLATMIKLVLVCCLVALVAARPQDFVDDSVIYQEPRPQYRTLEDAGILRMESSMNEDGSFQYGFETTDPIQQDVAGQPKQIGEEIGIVMQGSYSFQTPEGQTITVNWVADENGFQPQGDAIPVDANAAAQAAAFANAPQQVTFDEQF
ncbi:Larval cuticle protein LCP-22 [Amphibalanus amphitrite]|uniref:Larval cuticle protein LCP-22 n=2 Tax=Amphibalanus amphitrite TaxID=1232801 RepID=A0A6A4WA05_AMPAM|nr:Larval cuticle protein LCP-22 [Amphibalanus amphitrite]